MTAAMPCDSKDRFGIDIGRRLALQAAIDWAVERGVRHIDLCLDSDSELLRNSSPKRKDAAARLKREGIVLGLHTLSAVNVAESAPFLSEACDAYLEAYVDAANALGAGWIVVHAGFHFTGDKQDRMEAALTRLDRVSRIAERAGVTLLLENMNREPDDAEVKYLGHDLDECRYFFDQLHSPNMRWSYTVNHAHLLSGGIEGFLNGMDLKRCGEVRLADCRGTVEEHLRIGEGTIDFPATFRLLESAGYRGHYMLAFKSLDVMYEDRELLARMLNEVTVVLGQESSGSERVSTNVSKER